tara:strand:- start:2471 stop:2962 length:492 start_codon:yes stop_codon:yes gene_type:complete
MSNFISNEAKLLLSGISLSNNPTATVVDDPDMSGGKINVTSDGRKYYLATFRDVNNPFAPERTRVISQTTDASNNPIWRAGNPSIIKQFVGKAIPADIVTRTVEPYTVGSNVVETYSCIVMKGESIKTIFKQQGHELTEDEDMLVDTADAPEVSQEAETNTMG